MGRNDRVPGAAVLRCAFEKAHRPRDRRRAHAEARAEALEEAAKLVEDMGAAVIASEAAAKLRALAADDEDTPPHKDKAAA
ncbi:MAG TPA: hypothetical protein DCS82_01010 [Rhodospirillaceae bacterium]|nr:hypothetical protein [Rhodospirillaceae bacterium]HAT34268.1 hypothetical protein [Rhodospirillaceae bacterium]